MLDDKYDSKTLQIKGEDARTIKVEDYGHLLIWRSWFYIELPQSFNSLNAVLTKRL